MNQDELASFIEVALAYFESSTGVPASMGIPTLKKGRLPLYEFTGIIGVSGSRRGAVCFSATREMLAAFAEAYLGEGGLDDDGFADLVGEMANTFAGNARKSFGPRFMISVPIVVRGAVDDIEALRATRSFVIPVEWAGQRCKIGIAIE
jgi:chemotaxis protein CheX